MQYKRSRLLCVPSLPHSLLFHNFQTYCRRINHRSTRRILNPNISTVNSEGGEETIGCSISRPFGFIQSHFPSRRLDCTLLSRLNSIEEEPSRYFRHALDSWMGWLHHVAPLGKYQASKCDRLARIGVETFHDSVNTCYWRFRGGGNRVGSTRSPYFFVIALNFSAFNNT